MLIAARAAEAKPLVLEQVEDVGQGLAVGDLVGVVDRQVLEVGRDPPLADALGDRVARRLEFARRVVADRAPRPRDRQARSGSSLLRALSAIATPPSVPPEPTEQMNPSTLPPRLLEDLGPGALDMRLPVGDVVELVRPDRAARQLLRQLLGQPPRNLHVVVGVLVGLGRHLDQLGAIEPDRVLLLLALRLGDDDHRLEPHRIGDQREPDPGVARRPLDDRPARPQQPRASPHRG